MGKTLNLLSPRRTRSVPVERVAVLIADAIVGRPPGSMTVVLRGKHLPRIGSSSGTLEIAPLLEEDWVCLSRIWQRLPDFATLRLEAWSDYLELFATSIHRPRWRLAWDVTGQGSSDFGRATADAYINCLQLHRRQLTRAMSQGQLVVREAMSGKSVPWFSARDAVLDIEALENYAARFKIHINWMQLPTEDAAVEATYDFVGLPDGPCVEVKRDSLATVCMRQLYASVTKPFRNLPAAVLFLSSDFFLLADAVDTKIEVEAQFRAWLDRRGVLPKGGASLPAPAPLYVHPSSRRYRTLLDDVLALARSQALNPSSHQSAWLALLDLAGRAKPPAPLVGLEKRHGEVVVLYESSHSCKPLTRNGHRQRFTRFIRRGLA